MNKNNETLSSNIYGALLKFEWSCDINNHGTIRWKGF